MKAIAQHVYGPAEVLQLRDLEPPAIGADEVLVDVRASAIDAGVWILMTGRPYAARLAFGLRRPKVAVRGMDLAGVVSAVGANVTGFSPGDEVYGISESGSFAEQATAKADRIARKPANLTFEQAAAMPVSAVTALQAVRHAAAVRPGQRVLVTGASGGVGSFAVQLAKAAGASVTGVCSTSKVDLVRSLGADEVIDYTKGELDGSAGKYDVIIDVAGNRPVSLLRRAMTPRGTLVMVGGGHRTGRVFGGMERVLGAVALGPFVGQQIRNVASRVRADRLEELTKLIEAGQVTPAVGRAYPLAEAPAAMRDYEAGRAAGKLVVTV